MRETISTTDSPWDDTLQPHLRMICIDDDADCEDLETKTDIYMVSNNNSVQTHINTNTHTHTNNTSTENKQNKPSKSEWVNQCKF